MTITQMPAIDVQRVSKTFRLPHEQRTHLKEYFLHPLRHTTYERQRALDNVTFDIGAGEFFGVIGPNGSGKSTLLKILAGIYRQDSGSVRVNGLLSPFIELGVGFNPELTGRDNIRINGTLLGLTRRQIDAAFRRDCRVRRARAVRRPEAEELLLGDAAAARVLDRDPGRRSTSSCSTRCLPSATQAFQQKCYRAPSSSSSRSGRRSSSSATTSTRSSASATERCCSSAGSSTQPGRPPTSSRATTSERPSAARARPGSGRRGASPMA